ncbi:acetyltransferase [Klebsiella grimontii]|nr:acetyltransferase [Klebsiella grimontii]
MPPLLIAAITPDEPGFSALRAESQAQNLNMLRPPGGELAKWENRFNAPEKSYWEPLPTGSWSAFAG